MKYCASKRLSYNLYEVIDGCWYDLIWSFSLSVAMLYTVTEPKMTTGGSQWAGSLDGSADGWRLFSRNLVQEFK